MTHTQRLNAQAEKIAEICKSGATTSEIKQALSKGLYGSMISSQIHEEITHAITSGKIVKDGVKIINEWGTQEWIYKAVQ